MSTRHAALGRARSRRSLAAPAGLLEEAINLVIAVVALLLVGTAEEAKARAGTEQAPLLRLGDIEAGQLVFRTEDPGLFLPAPMVDTEVSIDVSGPIARTIVRQRFHNPTAQWLEGVYVFPLPERSAVDGLRMRIGDRFIEGRIAEREAARRAYQQAAAAGQRASLLEQERPNVFTTSVANIGPDEAIIIEIRYQEILTPKDGLFSLRFPMVVAPRYVPHGIELASYDRTGSGRNNHRVPDAERVTPPVLRPEAGPVNPVRLTVRLDAGMPLAKVASLYHPVAVSEGEDGVRTIMLADGPVPADRDFVLHWQPEASALPRAVAFVEEVQGEDYAMVMLMPPETDREAASGTIRPREMILVIDTSGSMAGESIRQAKAALLFALERLSPADRFNIIRFNSTTDMLFPAALPADPGNLRRARAYVAGLEADGGTEIAPALLAALGNGGGSEERLRQVVFLTDGAVANEEELFAVIKERLGSTRLFAVGIGSAPNGHFLDGATRAGRGAFTHIGAPGEVEETMRRLLDKLAAPALTDIAVWFDGDDGATSAFPNPLPDLYAGEPVVLTARLSPGVSRVSVGGRRGAESWTADLALAQARRGEGVAKLWAREKIAFIEDARLAGADPDAVRDRALEVALTHGLLTRYTSLVAVDVTPARPAEVGLEQREVPLNLPAGWEYDKVFGGPAPLPPKMRDAMLQRATASLQTAAVRLAEADAAGAAVQPSGAAAPVPLPATATWSQIHLASGLVLLLIALAIWRLSCRRETGA